MQVVEPDPLLQLARAAVHAVGEGQLVACWLPMQGDVAPRAGRHRLRLGEALATQQLGEAGAHGRAVEGLDHARMAERVEEPIGQGKGQGIRSAMVQRSCPSSHRSNAAATLSTSVVDTSVLSALPPQKVAAACRAATRVDTGRVAAAADLDVAAHRAQLAGVAQAPSRSEGR